MSTFERYLTLWVALCIVAGIALGHFFAPLFQLIGSAEIARVNLPVAVLIWLMIVPMLMKVDWPSQLGPDAAASDPGTSTGCRSAMFWPPARTSAQAQASPG